MTTSLLLLLGLLVLLLLPMVLHKIKQFFPQQIEFYPYTTWGDSKFSKLPFANEFEKKWEWVEKSLARKKIYSGKQQCRFCNRTDGNYSVEYTYKKYKWTGWDRNHIMHGHVRWTNDGGYHMPEQKFINMIMAEYAKHAPKNEQIVL